MSGARTLAAARCPRGAPDRRWHNARPMPSQERHLRHLRRLRHSHRLGDGHRRRLREGGARDGFTIDRDELIPLFHEISREIEGGSYELYAEVLRRTAIEIAKRIGWPLEPSRSGFLPDSVQRWRPFKETNAQLAEVPKKFEVGLISNIDDKLLGQTRRHIPLDFDLVVTAQQVRSYKPDPAHFKECARRIGGKKGWVHVAS